MSDYNRWSCYDYTDPQAMAKCRERQKLYYNKRKNTIVTCHVCERNLMILQYINTGNLKNIKSMTLKD